MRLSDLTGKEVINLADGARLGVIEECELMVDGKTGRIQSLVIPNRSSFFKFFSDSRNCSIPWRTIKRIGNDVIIVDMNNAFDCAYNSSKQQRLEDTY